MEEALEGGRGPPLAVAPLERERQLVNIPMNPLKPYGQYTHESTKALWSIYVPLNLFFKRSTFFPHNVSICSVRISQQSITISLSNINRLVLATQRECVYCAVRTEY
jgi:hypothetical protein